ncbi:MAG: ion channel [Actinomycetota bacterium]|nr:ion channel [Actinomycetota bacterium]
MRLPNRALGPGKAVTRRVFLALSLIAVTAALVYLDRRGYEDAAGDGVSLADVFYYATVSVTTTGYGDITPVTSRARAITTVIVTPTRVLFLILVVGTTVEDLLEVGAGLDIIERPVSPHEQGGPPRPGNGELVVAVVRSEELLRFDDPRIRRLEPGDWVVALCARDRR